MREFEITKEKEREKGVDAATSADECKVLSFSSRKARQGKGGVVINAGLGHGRRNVSSAGRRGWLVHKKASGRALALTINNRVRGYVQV